MASLAKADAYGAGRLGKFAIRLDEAELVHRMFDRDRPDHRRSHAVQHHTLTQL